jgi:hypothetical protein
MQPLVRPTLAATIFLALLAGCSILTPRPSGERVSTAGLHDGARSVDELVQDFVLAIREKDPDGLRRLRVNEEEYRQIIIPGSVPPSQPAAEYVPQFQEFLWGSLDMKNRYGERQLLTRWGGRTLSVEKTSFGKGMHAYRGYTAHDRLELTLRDDQGAEVRFEMGSVAQVGHRYKFISFMRD